MQVDDQQVAALGERVRQLAEPASDDPGAELVVAEGRRVQHHTLAGRGAPARAALERVGVDIQQVALGRLAQQHVVARIADGA